MTKQVTAVQQSKHEALRLIGITVFTFAMLGGVALWQVWPSEPAATPATSAIASAVRSPSDGGLPRGGLAERYDEMRAAAANRGANAFVPAPESPLNAPVAGATGGVTDLGTRQQVNAAPMREMGGMAELYRDQAFSMTHDDVRSQASTCGLTYTQANC